MRPTTLLPLLALALIPAVAPAQSDTPVLVPARLSLVEAVRLGRTQAVSAVLAGLNVRVADARQGQRRADLLPFVAASARYNWQTLNLDEFGLPNVSGVTPPFDLWSFQVRATQSIYDASLWARTHAASDSAKAAGLDAVTPAIWRPSPPAWPTCAPWAPPRPSLPVWPTA